jgi:inner membrane protein
MVERWRLLTASTSVRVTACQSLWCSTVLTPTHLAAAHAAYLAACLASAHPPDPAEAAVALLGGLLPDLDSPRSYVGRVLPPLSGWIERTFGHRTITHALLTQAGVGALAWWLLPGGFFMALMAGWLSHACADMMTPSGACWFWPARVRCVLPGNARYRMETMGNGELGFLLVMALACILLMPMAATGKGSAGLIRAALGNLEAARAEYDRDKGSYAFEVVVRGRDNATFADIAGRYPVRGPWRDTGLILDTDAGPVSLCTGSACDWYADHAALERAGRQDTTASTLAGALMPICTLEDRVAALAASGSVYLLGSVLAAGVAPAPPTLEVEGEQVRFVYAGPEMLARLKGKVLRDVNVVIQTRHAPGAEVAAPPAPAAPAAPALHPLLQRYWIDPAGADDGGDGRMPGGRYQGAGNP